MTTPSGASGQSWGADMLFTVAPPLTSLSCRRCYQSCYLQSMWHQESDLPTPSLRILFSPRSYWPSSGTDKF